MIDVHCHLFNARSLPLRGIFRSRGVPATLAALFDNAIRTIAADDHALDGMGDDVLVAHAGDDRDHVAGAGPGPRSREQCAEWLVERFPESLLRSADFSDALGTARGARPEERRRTLAAYLAAPDDDNVRTADAVRFVVRLLRSERDLLSELTSIAPGVELFVHHMMDMEYAYGDRPDYDYVRQLRRMRNLASRSGGRVLGFVAFEPFRPGSRRIVTEALEQGFCGVKFYPPSGYRPTGNVATGITDDPPRSIDRRNHELFRLCVERDVPILAHCTPGGFERLPGRSGRFSNPRYWRTVLARQRYRTLRLCLGHAGGDDGWFDEIPADGGFGSFFNRYAGRVVRLCVDYPNVYCGFGHMEHVLDPEGRRRLSYWLAKLIGRYPVLASKILYGSDYPMLLQDGTWRDYLPAMKQVFHERPELRTHAGAFFKTNALAYLNLPRFLHESGETLSDAEREHLRRVLTTPADRSLVAGVEDDEAAEPAVAPRGLTRATAVRAVATSGPAPRGLRPPIPAADAANPVDCLVLGAGLAGITAAREVRRDFFRQRPRTPGAPEPTVLVLEGSERIGGRLHTLRGRLPLTVELGAELIHRPPPLHGELALQRFWSEFDRYGIATVPIDKLDNGAQASLIYFRQWSDRQAPLLRPGCDACNDKRFKAGIDALDAVNSYRRQADETAAAFIERFICDERGFCADDDVARATADYLLTGTVPGESDELSAASLRFDRVKQQEHSSEEFHVAGGYDALPRTMAQVEEIPVLLGARVTAIEYDRSSGGGVVVRTDDGRVFHGRTAVCSFSVGMLKSGQVTFAPPLPAVKREALDVIELGPESKIAFEFTERFWPASMALLSNPGVRRGGRSYFVPPYGQLDVPVLTAFLTRQDARDLDDLMPDGGEVDDTTADDAVLGFITERVLPDLSEIFTETLRSRGRHPLELERDVAQFHIRSWTKDPFALGAASFVRFDGRRTEDVEDLRATLADPTETSPLFWAGEATATNIQPWSVHGAHASGARAAWQVRTHLDLFVP